MRVLLETSITRFVQTGLATYATNLARALESGAGGVEIVRAAVPSWMEGWRGTPLRRVCSAYWQIVHARRLARLASRARCDLIHYTMTMPIPANLPCPVIATVHDLIPFAHPEWVAPLRGWRLRAGIGAAVRRARHIIAVSEATRRETLARFGLPPERVTAVWEGPGEPLPVLSDEAAQRRVKGDYGLARGYVLCGGSIEPRKNLQGMLAAYRELARPWADVPPLVVVGGITWQPPWLSEALASPDLKPHLRVLGHLPADALAALFRCAGVFVYPSLYEGFGLPPFEAWQNDCPVIASNVSSLPEVLADGAWLVDPHDVGSLAGALRDILRQPGLADRWRERGRTRMRRFSWTACAEQTAAVYRKVAET